MWGDVRDVDLRHKTEWWMWCKGCWLRHNAECDVM